MRILLTNLAMKEPGGTESWTLTMAQELAKEHQVAIYTLYPGLRSQIASRWARIVGNITPDYDLAISNHLPCYGRIPSFIPRIFTSHSVIFPVEAFPKDNSIKVAVTEEIRDVRQQPDATIIRNGIDCERYAPRQDVSPTPKKALYIAKKFAPGIDTIKEACQKTGVTLEVVDSVIYTDEAINRADIVISHGRGLLEGMACGRNVVSADHRSYMKYLAGAGAITEENFDELKTHAFSGRKNPIQFSVESLAAEIKKYDPARGNKLRQKILAEYDIKLSVKKYLNLWTSTKNGT